MEFQVSHPFPTTTRDGVETAGISVSGLTTINDVAWLT